jgi:hypothetical protein
MGGGLCDSLVQCLAEGVSDALLHLGLALTEVERELGPLGYPKKKEEKKGQSRKWSEGMREEEQKKGQTEEFNPT